MNSKKDVVLEVQKEKRKVLFATLMDICHLKNAELEAKHQKYKGRVVLRGDIVKDDSGAYAMFTEQGSSASQMTASKVMDVIPKITSFCKKKKNQRNINLHPHEKDAPRLLKIPRFKYPNMYIRFPRHNWPTSWANIADGRLQAS